MRKELSHVMLELYNMRIKLSNVRKKERELPNVKRTVTCDKNRADVILVLLNMTMEPSNLRNKK